MGPIEQQMTFSAVIAELLPTIFAGQRLLSDEQSPDQAMRFGVDVPEWAINLGQRIAQIDGLFDADIRFRCPLFNQLIVNSYAKGQGICRHIDLLRFEDGIVGLSLQASCTLTMREIANTALPISAGSECS